MKKPLLRVASDANQELYFFSSKWHCTFSACDVLIYEEINMTSWIEQVTALMQFRVREYIYSSFLANIERSTSVTKGHHKFNKGFQY